MNMESTSRLVDPERNLLRDGFEATAESKINKHPLLISEPTFDKRREQRDFSMLRSIQGIQAPLKLMMERKAASQVGHLPFIASSNAMLETLKGRDWDFGPEDMFNEPMSDRELMGPPHMVMERHLDIL